LPQRSLQTRSNLTPNPSPASPFDLRAGRAKLVFVKLKILHDNCGAPFLARLAIFTIFGLSLKLHIFLRSDADIELHDHPWSFWTLILCGGYNEVTEKGVITRKPGSLSFRPAKWRHRVELNIKQHPNWQELRPCATLVLTMPVKRDWGFWRDGKFIPWREFKSNHNCE
jgi:hypothetical protein